MFQNKEFNVKCSFINEQTSKTAIVQNATESRCKTIIVVTLVKKHYAEFIHMFKCISLLYCIVFVNFYSTAHSSGHSVVLPVQESRGFEDGEGCRKRTR